MTSRRLVLVLPLLVLSCASKPPRDLLVTSFTGRTGEDAAEPIRFRFNRAVVAADRVGVKLGEVPVAILPLVALEARWEDPQTLVLVPTGELAPSTAYTVTLRGELGKRTETPTFTFVHLPVIAKGVSGADLERVPPAGELVIGFNQPVRGGDLVKQCRLQGSELTVVVGDPAKVAPQHALHFSGALEQGTSYQLVCEKLVGAGGTAAAEENVTVDFKTYPAFTVGSFLPDGNDVPSDQVAIKIAFSNPVELADVAKALSAKPAIRGLAKGWLDETRTRYTVEVDLDAEVDYTLSVAKGLADVYGQKLESAETHEFHTGVATPRISLETGIFAVERGGKGYPIWTRNLGVLKVDCARIPSDKLVGLLTTDLDYDPWYDASTNKAIEWGKLGLKGKLSTIRPASKKNNWHLTPVPLNTTCAGGLADDERGVFLAEVGSPELKLDEEYSWRYRPRQRVLANVTDLGVLLKVGPASGLVWVTSLKSGKPVGGATVSIYDLKGNKTHTAVSDQSGLVRLPGADKLLRGGKPQESDPEEEWSAWRSQRVIATVEKDGDLAVVDGNWQNGIQIWNFGVKEDRSGGAARVRGFIQSDRGLYRPGETVSFKGIAREIVIGQPPRQTKEREIAIEVTDPRGSVVLEQKVTLTKFGGFSFELPLSTEAALGDWWVTAKIGAQSFREKFLVEEFRKVEYEVKVAGTGGRHVARGSKLAWTVNADYLFGAPVTKAKVKWTVERRKHLLRIAKFPEYGFTDISENGYDWWWSYEEPQLSFLGDGEGETDAKGAFSFAFEDPEAEREGPQDYVATAEVRDETDQTVSKQVVVTAHPSEFYFGMHTQEWVQAVGMPFAVNAVAVKPDGTQVAATGKLSLVRRRENCNYSGGYRAEVSCTPTSEVLWTRDVTIPATGTVTERIMPKIPGEFIIRLDGKDAKGNPVAVSSWVWVLGKGEAFWSGDESDRMSIIASKQAYEPGETARLVPRTNLAGGSSLVSVERNGVIDAFVVETSSSGEGIELKLTDAHAPNVYVAVAAVRGRTGDGDRNRPRFQMGVTELDVSAAAQRLEVSVKTDRPSYQPGEEVTGVIKVVAKGKPASAEVSLSVADEGVLQLIAYKTPDPMTAFYAPWGLGIDAATNWNRISRLADPRVLDPDEGGDGGDSEGGAKIRSKFVNSAYWAPALVTDGKGEIRFKFTAPDNLTAFRLMAVAADMGSRFGSAENRVTTKKPLLLKPVLPRFLAEGDRAQVGVVVHNYTGAAGKATVTAKGDGVPLSGTQTVDVAKDGTARVMFDLDVGKLGPGMNTATFEFAASLGESKDAMRLSLPLSRPLAYDNVLIGSGKVEGSVSLPLAWDDGVLPADSLLALSVDRTGLGELEGSLKYLIEYPYGCLEQTMSRFIPLVKVKDLAASLDLKDLPGGKLDRYIAAGVARVYKFQHGDGQFSLWQDGEPQPHLTVYALFGLGEAKKAGVEIDPSVMKRGLEQVKRWANGPTRKLSGYEGGTMAMAAYVLAQNDLADSGLASRLYAGYRGLPVYGQAFLLLAMEKGKSPAKWRQALAKDLAAQVKPEGLVDEPEDADSYWAMSSDVRTSAIVMMALLAADSGNPVIERLAAGLKKAQGKRGYWRNTQENLYSLVALAELARKDADGTTKITASVGGKKILGETLTGGRVVTVKVPLAQLGGGKLSIESQGTARFSARLTLARRIDDATPASEGFTLSREFLDPDKDEVKKTIKTGDLVKVVVRVKPRGEKRYVAVVDPLPAGFELVNSKLVTSVGREREDLSSEQHGWWSDSVWTNIELRDDRVQAFADWLPNRDEVRLVYLVRATLPGKFTAPPTRAEAMYEPEVFARGKATKIEVKR